MCRPGSTGSHDAAYAAWRDPADPARIRDDLQPGDHIHGNDAGYRALADAVDLSLFG